LVAYAKYFSLLNRQRKRKRTEEWRPYQFEKEEE